MQFNYRIGSIQHLLEFPGMCSLKNDTNWNGFFSFFLFSINKLILFTLLTNFIS